MRRRYIFAAVPHNPLDFDFRYNAGLSNIVDQGQTGFTGSVRNGVFQIGMTYVLFSM